MIYRIWCRLLSALHVLFIRRVMLIEQTESLEHKRDRITLWTSIDDKEQQIFILRQLANSVERDLIAEKKCTFGEQTE